MTLMIDTNAVPAPDRVDFWAKSSCDAYHPLHIGTDRGDRFWARMWADHLGSVGVYRIAAGPNTMRRTPRDIAAGDPECLHVSLLLRGRLYGAQQHRATALAPGDITSYDTSQPAIFRADAAFDLLVLRLPKVTLGKHAGKVSRLTAVTIPGEAGLPRLAARFFCEAANGLADGSIASGDTGLAEHVID
ncbi:MAG: cupin domain-containing protein, partial [Solirubrobacteraceae bacterium]